MKTSLVSNPGYFIERDLGKGLEMKVLGFEILIKNVRIFPTLTNDFIIEDLREHDFNWQFWIKALNN